MKHRFHYEMPIGTICIEAENEKITGLYLDGEMDENECETELIREAHRQLSEYFKQERTEFDLPLQLHGTEFQKRVWKALQTIPYGETRSYGELAKMTGNPKACRAVGGANHRNRILIVVPCHRVIGADGSLVGFGGGLDAKAFLLELEKQKL